MSGPHSSRLANALDPRVDSNAGTTTTGAGQGVPATTDPTNTTAGPHSSNLANKVDPTVDSDLDHRARVAPGTTRTQPSAGSTTTPTAATAAGVAGSGTTGTTGTAGTAPDTGTTATGTTTSNVPVTGHTTTGTAPAAGTTAPTTTKPSGGGIGHGIKAAAAQLHGAGETIRGSVNSAVDRTFNEPTGVAKNENVANQGVREMETGNFNATTKAREGVNPATTTTPGRRI